MYSVENENLVISIVIALFLVPVIIFALKRNILKQFRFSSLISVLNWAFLIQIIEGIIFLIAGMIVDRHIDENKKIDLFTDVFIGADYTFLVIGVMIYFPSLVTLNIINWVGLILKKRSKKRA
jgi:hypothetical protein